VCVARELVLDEQIRYGSFFGVEKDFFVGRGKRLVSSKVPVVRQKCSIGLDGYCVCGKLAMM
jgi:hypothetical protein